MMRPPSDAMESEQMHAARGDATVAARGTALARLWAMPANQSSMSLILSIGILLTSLASIGLPASAAQAVSETQLSLQGQWHLNRELSSQPPASLPDGGAGMDGRQGRPPMGGGGPGGFGGGRGGGMGRPGGRGGGNPGSGPPSEADRQRMLSLMREVLESPRVLMVNINPTTVTFTDGEGYVRKHATNGKPEKHQMPSGTVETRTKWSDSSLVVETTVSRMMKITKTFTVGDDPRRLVVETSFAGRRSSDAPPLKAVYDEGPPPEIP